MIYNDELNFFDYGKYVCKIGPAMDGVGITLSKMRRLTGLNYDTIKKYYRDDVVRIDKEVFARISYVIMKFGVDHRELFEYKPPVNDKKGNL